MTKLLSKFALVAFISVGSTAMIINSASAGNTASSSNLTIVAGKASVGKHGTKAEGLIISGSEASTTGNASAEAGGRGKVTASKGGGGGGGWNNMSRDRGGDNNASVTISGSSYASASSGGCGCSK